MPLDPPKQGKYLTPCDASDDLGNVKCLWLTLLLAIGGCASTPASNGGPIVIVVPGAGGSSGLGGLVQGLRDVRPDAKYEIFHWGAPPPLFLLNLQNQTIHDDAERKLADVISRRATTHSTVQVVAHSAGCGVAMGALKRLSSPDVSRAVLLAPSVSPGYDLSASMRGVAGEMHVFHSTRDTFWLSWRTGTFGTYDNVKTKAAGNRGFDHYPTNVIQHPYDDHWETLGHRGGHFDVLARRFVRDVVAPLLFDEPSRRASTMMRSD